MYNHCTVLVLQSLLPLFLETWYSRTLEIFFVLQTECVQSVIFLGSIQFEALKRVYDGKVSYLYILMYMYAL